MPTKVYDENTYINSQISTDAPFKFGNGEVISPHTLLWV